jgi:hypothetical protein
MIDDYQVPYSYEVKELANGMFQITITATGFLNSRDAERFLSDINNFEFDHNNFIHKSKPTYH